MLFDSLLHSILQTYNSIVPFSSGYKNLMNGTQIQGSVSVGYSSHFLLELPHFSMSKQFTLP